MEFSAMAVSSCDFRPPASGLPSTVPRSCCTRNAGALSFRAVEISRGKLGCPTFSNAGRKTRVGAMAGALCGQRMGIGVGSGARWTASTWLDNS